MRPGKFTWYSGQNTYSEEISDTTDSKMAQANARAATALGVAVSALRLKDRSGRPIHDTLR